MSDFNEFRSRWLSDLEKAKAYIDVVDGEYAKLFMENKTIIFQRDEARARAKRMKRERDALQTKLDEAKDALRKIPHDGYPDEREHHPWYPKCQGCMAERLLKELEATND